MKAFLLAAGLGTRLKPLTNTVPKCLIEIGGKPSMQWWIEHFEKHGITDVLINLHHLQEKVTDFLDNHPTKINFTLFYEETLHGTASTIKENFNFIKDEDSFLIVYADNLTNYNLTEFKKFHELHNSNFSMALFKTDSPRTKGIVKLGDDNKIISFEEKPENPKSNIANAGLYIAKPQIIELISPNKFSDIGFDLLPLLKDKMYGWLPEDYLIDIGTLEHLKKAELEWSIIQQNENSRI